MKKELSVDQLKIFLPMNSRKCLIIGFGMLVMLKIVLALLITFGILINQATQAWFTLLVPVVISITLSLSAIIGLERYRRWGFWLSTADILITSAILIIPSPHDPAILIFLLPLAGGLYLLITDYRKLATPQVT